MKKNKNFGFVDIEQNNLSQFKDKVNVQKVLIKDLIKKKANIYFLTLSFGQSSKKKIIKNYIIDNHFKCKIIKFYCKNSFIEFCKANKILLILWLPNQINLKIFNCWIALKKTTSKIIYINEESRPDDKYYTLSPSKKFSNFFNFNRIHKILVFLKVFPAVDYFLSTKHNKEYNKNSFFNKLNHNLFKNIKNQILIKNKLHNYKIKKSKKYIIFLDTAFYDHPAIQNQDQSNRKKFFKKLRQQLKFISHYFKKEIIICSHPKSNKKKVFDDYNGFKVKFYQTEDHIAKAFLVVFFFTSTIWLSMALNKPVIQLSENNLHNLWKLRINQFQNIFNFTQLNISNFLNNKILKDLYSNSQKKIIEYKKFKKNYLNSNKKAASTVLFELI